MLTCINLSKPRHMIEDKINELVFNYKMLNSKQKDNIKTIVKSTETALTISLLFTGVPVEAAVAGKIVSALNPLIDMIQGLGYPLAILSMSGGAITMMFNKRAGIRIIKDTSIAYLALQIIPGLMKILVEVGRALR